MFDNKQWLLGENKQWLMIENKPLMVENKKQHINNTDHFRFYY